MFGFMTGARLRFFMLAASMLVNGSAHAANSIDFSNYHPSAVATRINPHDAPKIDGDVSDEAWQKAPLIDQFYQVEPNAGSAPTRRTVARVLYDANALYVSFYCYTPSPEHLVAGAKARDTNVEVGEFVRLYLDPGLTRRNGYAFSVNPRGGRLDALVQNNSSYLDRWNTIWDAKVKIVKDGWTVEMKIPFRSISYDAKRPDWGFDLFRFMRGPRERVRWTSAIATIDETDISHAGTLTNVHDITQGLGLDIQTYGALRYKHEWVRPGREDDTKLALSGNLYYKITPALTGSATLNPDFSDTPLDERKINTTRFALFFPETRDFFLQDAAAFEFGGHAFEVDSNGLPFFSRNVGLVNGAPVPIRLGGKISGSLAGFGVGAFSALADGLGLEHRQILSVARITHPVLDESKAGIIFTNGDPTGSSQNSVAGADFQYRNSHLAGGKTLNAHIAYARSFSSTQGDDDEMTFSLQSPNEPWSWQFVFRKVGENFAPALGFVNRAGIRDYSFNPQKLVRVSHPFFAWYAFGSNQHFTTGLDNNLQSYAGNIYLGAVDNVGDVVFVYLNRVKEVVPASFGLGGAAIVQPGKYQWTTGEVFVDSSYGRKWILNSDVVCCDFYDGKALQLAINFTYRPDATWEIIPHYFAAFIDLPTGSVGIHAGTLDLNLNFTPDMQIKTEAQYDNLSHNLNFFARYRWEYSPGAEIFVALGENALITNRLSHYASQTSQASVRIGHTYRF